MKNVFQWSAVVVMLCTGLWACQDPCEDVVSDPVGGEFFTVTYDDGAGNNPLESGKWRPANVIVFIDSAAVRGGDPDFHRITPGFTGGTFGPFDFTDDFIDPATLIPNLPLLADSTIRFDYYIQKDTFGIDTFTVDFLLQSGECLDYYFWDHISYFLNGERLSAYEGRQQADIVITE